MILGLEAFRVLGTRSHATSFFGALRLCVFHNIRKLAGSYLSLGKMAVVAMAAMSFGTGQLYAFGLAGADFLVINTSPRAAALGEAYAALADDTASLQWNPAGLTGIKNIQLEFNHVKYFVDTRIEYGALAAALTPNDVVALSFYFDTVDDLFETDDVGFAVDALAFNLVFQASYARRFNKKVSVGLSWKTYKSVLLDSKASGWAIDFGAQYFLNEKFKFGASLLNAGPEIVFEEVGDPLPTWAKVGGTAFVVNAEPHTLSITTEANIPFGHIADVYANFGIEYGIGNIVFIRTGYSTALGRRRLAYGGGLGYKGFIFNYAFIPFGVLGNNHLLSMQVSTGFGKPRMKPWDRWIQKGDKAFDVRNYLGASEAYAAATKIRPERATAWKKKGRADLEGGRKEHAMKAFEEARRLDPSDKEVARWLGAEIRKLGDAWFGVKDYKAALEHYLAALEFEASDVSLWRQLGWTHFRLGNKQDTIDAFMEAYRLDPSDTKLRDWLENFSR